MKPLVSIVILNYNGAHYLKTFLPSVLATEYDHKEVVVADNGSTDDSLDLLSKAFPTVKVIKNSTNEGFAGGYNWALKQIEADYYILLNSDVQVDPKWVDPMVQFMEQNLHAGACQPKILAQKDSNSFEYAGASGGWIDAFGYPFSRGRVFDVCEQDNGQYNHIERIFWASGAAMMIRSKLFHALGGFDASFFAHQEEIDLCWRMQLEGHALYACPNAIVYHVGAGTLPRGGRKVFLNFRNNLIMLSKNLTYQELLWKLPIRFCLDGLSAWKGLLSGDSSFFTAIAKAHFAVIGYWLRGKVNRTKHCKPLAALDGVYNGSVVFQYFIKNRQEFDKIVTKHAHN